MGSIQPDTTGLSARSRPLEVNPDDLLASCVRVSQHADLLAAEHGLAASRIDAALPGCVGLSEAAMTAKLREWQCGTTVSVARMVQHAEALSRGAALYAQMDAYNSDAITAVASAAMAPQRSL